MTTKIDHEVFIPIAEAMLAMHEADLAVAINMSTSGLALLAKLNVEIAPARAGKLSESLRITFPSGLTGEGLQVLVESLPDLVDAQNLWGKLKELKGLFQGELGLRPGQEAEWISAGPYEDEELGILGR